MRAAVDILTLIGNEGSRIVRSRFSVDGAIPIIGQGTSASYSHRHAQGLTRSNSLRLTLLIVQLRPARAGCFYMQFNQEVTLLIISTSAHVRMYKLVQMTQLGRSLICATGMA